MNNAKCEEISAFWEEVCGTIFEVHSFCCSNCKTEAPRDETIGLQELVEVCPTCGAVMGWRKGPV